MVPPDENDNQQPAEQTQTEAVPNTADQPQATQPAEQPAQPMPAPDNLKVIDTKTYGLTGMQKEVLQNFLNIQALNQFQLRAHLQLMAEQQWGIKADQFVRFGLDLEKNQITVEFLEPPTQGAGTKLETAPPAPSK